MWAQYLDEAKAKIIAVYASEQTFDYCYDLDTTSAAYKDFYIAMPDYVKIGLPNPTQPVT